MTPTNEFWLVLGMALVTFAIRYPVLAILGRVSLPERMMRALRYVPTAVLSAIILPGLVAPNNVLTLTPSNAYLVAGLFSIAVAAFTRKLLPTIFVGMVFFLIWRALFPPI